MSLQIGAALREAAHRLGSRTGGILLGTFIVVLLGYLTVLNTLLAAAYAELGLDSAVRQLSLVLDVPLGVAGVGLVVAMLLSVYHSIVAFRTFVAGTGDRFPDGAFTHNVPLAVVNLLVGSVVYGTLVTIGTVLLVVPGIFAYIAFMFMAPYVIVEDRNFVDALRASYRLTSGNRLMLFVLLVVVVALSGLLGAVTGLVAALVFAPPATQLVTVLLQVPVSLYVTAVIAVVFDQLRNEATADDPPSTPVDANSAASV